MSKDNNWRVRTWIGSIDTEGFTMNIGTWSDTTLYFASAAWVAYPFDKPGVHSGRQRITDLRSWDQPQRYNSQNITFEGHGFESVPKAFCALSALDVDKKAKLTIKGYVDNVTKTKLTWHIDASDDDAVLYHAALTWLCFV